MKSVAMARLCRRGRAMRPSKNAASPVKLSTKWKTNPIGLIARVLLGFACFTTIGVPASVTLADYIAEADTAYRNLPASLSAYNAAVREICGAMQTGTPQEFVASLQKMGVSFNSPKIRLPLRHVQIAAPSLASNRPEAGIPMVVGYETKSAHLYPPEGLFLDATAIYDRSARRPRFSLLAQGTTVARRGHKPIAPPMRRPQCRTSASRVAPRREAYRAMLGPR